jgi:hypothetical protein
MNNTNPARAIKLWGTEQSDAPGRVLRAGPLTVELDNGQIRYLQVNGVEVLRGIAFLVRDENWGTYVPEISDLEVSQRADGFSVSYHGVCRRGGQQLGFDIDIEGRADGSLEFNGTAIPQTDFLTARTGFVVLHPLKGVVGKEVEVEHVDGSVKKARFPERIDPVQPFLHIRSLTHEVLPGVRASVRMEGDTWEMEDHRNWTDASFKTYVRPLALPWPYVLKAGEVVKQAIKFRLTGAVAKQPAGAKTRSVEVRLGAVRRETVPPVGLGVPAEEIAHAIAQLDLLKHASPRQLICHFDPREDHGKEELYGYRVLAEQTGAQAVLEIVVDSIEDYGEELAAVAQLVHETGIALSAVAVCPVGDLKSVLPAGDRPPAPPLDGLYAAARRAFPGIKLGGGMFSFFTELNRKHPPAKLLDFVMNTTCPIVHAADDRSVMETLEALPYQVSTARGFTGRAPYRVGPSAIGCRDNPHGKTFAPNPRNERVCLAQMDPRQRGLFGAAWTLGYLGTLARTGGLESVSMGAPTGPLGIIYRKTDYPQPGYDELQVPAVYPAYHVIAGLSRAAGSKLVAAGSSDPAKVECLAYRTKAATLLWLANLTASTQDVSLQAGANSGLYAGLLDEHSYARAISDPLGFESAWTRLKTPRVKLPAYAVAWVCIND